MSRRHLLLVLGFTAIIASRSSFGSCGEAGYYRWPTVNDEFLIFGSEGDLWRSDAQGRGTVRLTTHVEVESSPRISPDGRWVAFDASYDGGQQVYLMPTTGGVPKQLTFEAGTVEVRGWSPDGRVVYRSSLVAGPGRDSVLRWVDPTTLQVETLPLAGARDVTFSAAGDLLFVTRHGLDMSADHARLYRGGRMAQLWRFELGKDEEAVRLAPDFDAPI